MPDSPDRRLDATGDVLFRLVVLGRRISSTRPHPFGHVRLSRTQLDALLLLAHDENPVTAGALSAALGLTPGAVTQLVDTLADLGLVDRSVDPCDKRVRRLQLCEPARRDVKVFEDAMVDEVLPWFGGLDDAEVRELGRLLRNVELRGRGG